MPESADDATRRAIKEHERELWAELNRRLQETVPKGAKVVEAQIAMAAALTEDPQCRRLYARVALLALHGHGFLHDRLEDRDGTPSVLSALSQGDDGPIEVDIGDAFSVFVDSTGERVQISLMDSGGGEIAAVSGLLIGPEAIEQEGQRFGELAVSRDGMTAAIRIPDDPKTQCMIAPDGTVTGLLPTGGGWSVVYPDAKRD